VPVPAHDRAGEQRARDREVQVEVGAGLGRQRRAGRRAERAVQAGEAVGEGRGEGVLLDVGDERVEALVQRVQDDVGAHVHGLVGHVETDVTREEVGVVAPRHEGEAARAEVVELGFLEREASLAQVRHALDVIEVDGRLFGEARPVSADELVGREPVVGRQPRAHRRPVERRQGRDVAPHGRAHRRSPRRGARRRAHRSPRRRARRETDKTHHQQRASPYAHAAHATARPPAVRVSRGRAARRRRAVRGRRRRPCAARGACPLRARRHAPRCGSWPSG
jgi:hypothetical protein